MAGSRLLRRFGRRIAATIAQRVEKNELFEQPTERPPQPPIFSAEPTPAPAPAAPPPPRARAEVDGCTVGGLDAVSVLLGPTGGVRVINHWATWCDPCVEELPLLAKLHRELAGEADFHGVSWDLFEGGAPGEVAAAVASFSRGHGIGYPSLLLDVAPESFFEALQLEFRMIPQTWVVSAGGEIIHRVEGILDEASAEQLAAVVRALGRP